MEKQRADAAIGSAGVKGDGAHRQNRRGTWETLMGGERQQIGGRHNLDVACKGVGCAHSSQEAG